MELNKNKTGIAVGLFLAIVHLLWALWIAISASSLQSFLDWIFTIHMLEPVWFITQFSILNTIWLVIMTFVLGYIFGWLFALCHNWAHKK